MFVVIGSNGDREVLRDDSGRFILRDTTGEPLVTEAQIEWERKHPPPIGQSRALSDGSIELPPWGMLAALTKWGVFPTAAGRAFLKTYRPPREVGAG